ncbi:hypothetical protein RRG08_046216 [Elysia crispata]|uniref:C-type lectin domain-containing protein n=1 Tax=Elysia crispata TaxID=231223 RepID=A0AAE0YNG1_9GAST|nr:hypothetical protein RRG08_046216 [Elysia crispata]
MEQNRNTNRSFDTCTIKFLFLLFLPLTVLANETCHLTPIPQLCPAGYDLVNDPRLCLHYTFQAMNWSEGRAYCQKAGADLVILRNYETAKSVHYYLQGKQETFYWLAFNDRVKEGHWVWDIPLRDLGDAINQTKKDMIDRPYQNFRSGRPIRNNPKRQRDQDCSVIEGGSGDFVETECSLRYKTLCQLHVQSGTTCLPNWQIAVDTFQLCSERSANNVKKFSITRTSCRPPKRKEKDIDYFYCIRAFWEELTWSDALKKCQEYNGELLKIETYKKLLLIKGYIQLMRLTWMGLQGRNQWWDQTEVWFSQYHDSSLPNATCHVILKDGFWMGRPCHQDYPVLCQRDTLEGSSDPVVHFQHHLPKNTFLLHRPVQVTCSSFGTQTSNMTWHIRDWKDNLISLPKSIKSIEVPTTASDGRCLMKMTSTLSFMPSKKTASPLSVSCFTFKSIYLPECFSNSTRFSFCGVLKVPFRLIDGPRRSPDLSVSYIGVEDNVAVGEIVIFSCNASIGKDEELLWMVTINNISQPLDSNLTFKFTQYVSLKIYQDTSKGDQHTSIISFRMQRFLDGISMACFAYNALNYMDQLTCKKTDQYCAESHKLFVASPKRYGK